MSSLVLVLACTGQPEGERSADPADPPTCWTLATVTGPEDLVVDAPGAPYRLLVSSRDIEHPSARDGIFSVPLDEPGPTVPAKRLPLVGRDDCSFHPHGISLVEARVQASIQNGQQGSNQGDVALRGPWLLYVVNHHDPEDSLPTAGCVRGAEAGKRLTSVEVFRVEPSRLVFVQRLADPSILTHANDLAATPDGDVWVTNPPPTTFGVLREGLFGHGDSKVVHFKCTARDGLRCDGRWSLAWDGGRFVNGIAYAASNDDSPDRVYVASSAGKVIHRLRVTSEGDLAEDECPTKKEDGCPIKVDGMPDNLTWLDSGRRTLLVAVHSNPRRYVQHSIRHQTRSPSRVEAIDATAPAGDGQVSRVFNEDGRQVSGASTALCLDGDLILGQVYGPHVLRCRDIKGCRGVERAAERWEASK